MNPNLSLLSFGPVPSRRLGQSLGINNIPAKSCSYSCIYCQVGRTLDHRIERQEFYAPEAIFEAVKARINTSRLQNERIDYVTFVPDGEPTLDLHLGREIQRIKSLGYPVAILTNASLIWQEQVKTDLLKADFVSVKVDAVTEKIWKRLDRPHKQLSVTKILDGIKSFAYEFEGKLVSETMLVGNIVYEGEFRKIADFLASLENMNKAYLAIPTRPPTEKWVVPASEGLLNIAYQQFSDQLGSDKVEYLIGYEGNAFASTGDVKQDLLSITAVHPMREEAVNALLNKTGSQWKTMEDLLSEGSLIELDYLGKKYYIRKFCC